MASQHSHIRTCWQNEMNVKAADRGIELKWPSCAGHESAGTLRERHRAETTLPMSSAISYFRCMFRSRLCGSTRLLSRIGRPIRSQHTENGPGSPYSAKRSSFLSPTFVALGLIPVLTFALGTWQVQRLRWKVDLIDQLTEKLQREPIPLPSKVK
jgi:hypothetical protein